MLQAGTSTWVSVKTCRRPSRERPPTWGRNISGVNCAVSVTCLACVIAIDDRPPSPVGTFRRKMRAMACNQPAGRRRQSVPPRVLDAGRGPTRADAVEIPRRPAQSAAAGTGRDHVSAIACSATRARRSCPAACTARPRQVTLPVQGRPWLPRRIPRALRHHRARRAPDRTHRRRPPGTMVHIVDQAIVRIATGGHRQRDRALMEEAHSPIAGAAQVASSNDRRFGSIRRLGFAPIETIAALYRDGMESLRRCGLNPPGG